MKRLLLIAVVANLLVLPAYPAMADGQEKVTICHTAGLEGTTHYVTLTIGYNAVYGPAGHFYENGTPQAGHEQDYLGPCVEPTDDPSPDPSPEPTEDPTPGPTDGPPVVQDEPRDKTPRGPSKKQLEGELALTGVSTYEVVVLSLTCAFLFGLGLLCLYLGRKPRS